MKNWYSAQELAGLSGLPTTPRRISEKSKRDSWQSRKREGRGGGFEYCISSLPTATQAELVAKTQIDSAPTKPSKKKVVAQSTDLLWQRYEQAPQSMKDAAQSRLNAINTALTLIQSGSAKTAAFEQSAEQFGMHRASIYRQYNQVKQYQSSDWLPALISNYKGFIATNEFSDEAWEYFKADYLRLESPTLMACYERVKRLAVENDWNIPSVKTIERWATKKIPHTTRILKRKGEHALAMLYPALTRSVLELHAGQWINGDGYEHNVFIEWPDGEIGRPKTWFWQDVYSRKIVAFRTDHSENTDVIRTSFGDVVEQYGIPSDVTIDNTRAAANKWMTGGVPNRYRFKVKEDDPIGLFPLLGCKVHWSSVIFGKGHGQAKPVERAFGVGGLGEYVDKHPAFAGAYTGPNVQAKPDNYGSKTIPLKTFLEVLNNEIIAWNAMSGRKTETGLGKYSFDEVFKASYEQATIKKATEEQRRLWLLQAEAIMVKADGSFTLQAGAAIGGGRNRYFNLDLIEYARQRIVIRFDPQTLHESVHCYTLDGRYICKTEIFEDAGFGDTVTAREYNRARRQFVKSSKEAAKSATKMDVLEVAAQMPTAQLPAAAIPAVIQLATPAQRLDTPLSQDPDMVSEAAASLKAMAADDGSSNVINLRSFGTDEEKYTLWQQLDVDVKNGIEITCERTRRFYKNFTSTTAYKVEKDMAEMRDEFERSLVSKHP